MRLSSLFFHDFRTRRSVLAAALGAALPVLLAGCHAKTRVAADQPVPVEVRTPKAVREPVAVAASGAVEANATALTAFQVSGRVARVWVEEGQLVKKGQVLAELDAADYRNAYEAAAGEAGAAAAQSLQAKNGLRPQELEQARIDYERARDEYQRMKYLYDRQSLAANDFHKIEAAYLAAQQRYEMARQGTRSEQKQAAGGQAAAARAQMSEARKRLGDTRLTAPAAGFVGMKKVDAGDTVAAGTPVFSVLDLDPVKVRVGIPEAEIGKVRLGARAAVTIPALEGRQFEGKVDAVGVAADPASRTYTVKIAVPNHAHVLRAGMVAEARIFSDQQFDALTLPGDAIVHDERGVTQVYVFDAGSSRVYARRVDPGMPVGTEVDIRSGLKADDRVVVAGQQNVREGSPVVLERTPNNIPESKQGGFFLMKNPLNDSALLSGIMLSHPSWQRTPRRMGHPEFMLLDRINHGPAAGDAYPGSAVAGGAR